MTDGTVTAAERHRREHDRVRAILDRLDLHLDRPAAPVDPEFARLRWTLARELATHLASERGSFPALRTGLRGDALYRGIDHALGQDLANHASTWTVVRIAADWPAFRREARLLARRLRRRMTYEETVLFPAATATA